MKGGSKEYWFVLTAESLSWYKDEEVRGNFLFKVAAFHWTHIGCGLAKIDDTAPQECIGMKILSLALLLGGLVPSAAAVAGGVCVPAQPNQCADYCSAVA